MISIWKYLPKCPLFIDKICFMQLAIFLQGMLVLFGVTLQTIWAIVLELSGRFHTQSVRTLASWKGLDFKTGAEKKYMSKFKKGCYPLSIGERGLFIVRRISVLKFLRAIVKGTFRALLTIGGTAKHVP